MAKQNFVTSTVWIGDNLPVMRGMNSECIDLIYLDPPFNSNRNYEAPIGSEAAGSAFKDMWTLDDIDRGEHGELADYNPALLSVISAARQSHGTGMMAYLTFMGLRMIEMKRILKPTGSIYLHCDPTASHYLKLAMDAIFGKENFRNEIIWRIGWVSGFKTQKKGWIRNHDTILYYLMSKEAGEGFNKEFIPYAPDYVRRDGKKPTGKGVPIEDTWNCSENDILDSIAIKSFSKEKTGYPTQKPLALLERIVRASSNKGDWLFDPFCGCATSMVAAEKYGRNWAGVDLSPLAVKLVDQRIENFRNNLSRKELDQYGLWKGAISFAEPPIRDDTMDLPHYRTHRHLLYGLQEGNCAGCGIHFPFKVMEVDHMLPVSKGGTDHEGNLQLLCSGCNRSKGAKTMAEWKATRGW